MIPSEGKRSLLMARIDPAETLFFSVPEKGFFSVIF
jgi:hypothetical protein